MEAFSIIGQANQKPMVTIKRMLNVWEARNTKIITRREKTLIKNIKKLFPR